MDNETLFYICGGVLAVTALVVTFLGLKLENFPGRAMPLIVIWFAVFVVGASTFAVRYSAAEQAHKAHELEEAGKEIEEAESAGGFENEGGALGGEREEGEREAEEATEGSPEEDEPVGPSEGSQEGGAAQTPGKAAGGGSTTLELAADPTALAFDKESLAAAAGEVTIEFENPSAIPHNVVIFEGDEELAGFEPITESQESLSAELEAGSYEFVCTVPGHAPAGMKGTLTVR